MIVDDQNANLSHLAISVASCRSRPTGTSASGCPGPAGLDLEAGRPGCGRVHSCSSGPDGRWLPTSSSEKPLPSSSMSGADYPGVKGRSMSTAWRRRACGVGQRFLHNAIDADLGLRRQVESVALDGERAGDPDRFLPTGAYFSSDGTSPRLSSDVGCRSKTMRRISTTVWSINWRARSSLRSCAFARCCCRCRPGGPRPVTRSRRR